MINPTREQVAVALFNKLSTLLYDENTNPSGPLMTVSRRPQLWDEATNMPALYMGNPGENYRYDHDTASPAFVVLDFDVFVYIKSGLDPTVIPDIELNNLMDAIEASITPYPGQNQTLGGIVHSAWIEGEIHRAPGYLDGRGIAIFTIKVMVPQ